MWLCPYLYSPGLKIWQRAIHRVQQRSKLAGVEPPGDFAEEPGIVLMSGFDGEKEAVGGAGSQGSAVVLKEGIEWQRVEAAGRRPGPFPRQVVRGTGYVAGAPAWLFPL